MARFTRFLSGSGGLAAAFALSLAVLAGAPPAQAAPPGFSESTDVVSVEVPVQVVKDGAPVRGLSAGDFALYDGRKRQPLTGFEVLDLAALPPPAGPAPALAVPVARRHFLLLFDLSFSEPRSIVRARAAARDLVKQRLQPRDLVAVATYSSRGPQLVLGFTPDRQQVEKAIATLGVPELVDRNPDPLRLIAAQVKESIVAHGHPRTSSIDDELEADLELIISQSERAASEVQKSRISAFSRSLADLAKLLASVQGRKEILYLSEGFDSSLLTGTTAEPEQADNRRHSQEAADNLTYTDSDQIYGSTRTGGDLERMIEEFRRADCVIQAVDIGGLRAEGAMGARRPSGQDSLFLMANETGGELYRNFNDLGAAMEQLLAKTSVTYVLSFAPEKLKQDSSYHRLRVELKNAARGVRVVARPGYYAPKPFAQQSALERTFATGSAIVAGGDGTGGPLGLAVLAAPFRLAASAKAYVPVLIEIDGPALLKDAPNGPLPTEVYAYAFDRQGSVQDYFNQTLGLDVAQVRPALEKSGVKFFGHLDLPAGDYSLRVLVRNGKTGLSDVRGLPLHVPAFGAASPVLLPPLFPEPPGRWLMVREAPRGAKRDVPYPFMAKDEPFIPAALPALAPGDPVKLALVAYGLAGEVQASSSVTGAGSGNGAGDGKAVAAGGELALVSREAGDAGRPDRFVATFKPPTAPGDYVLSVTLKDARGESLSSAAPFRVVARGGTRSAS